VFNVPKPVVLKLDESVDLAGKDGKMFCWLVEGFGVLAFWVAAKRENCGVDWAELAVENIDASLVVVSGGCELLGPNENRDEDFLVSFDDGVKVKSELDATILLDVSSGFAVTASALVENAPNENTGLSGSVTGLLVLLVVAVVDGIEPKLKLGTTVSGLLVC